jgi:hypothetical protein
LAPGPPAHVPEAGRAFPRPSSASRCLEPRERPENRADGTSTPWTGGPCSVVRRARAPSPFRPSAGYSRGSHVAIQAATAPPWCTDPPSPPPAPRCRAAGSGSAVPPRPGRRRRRAHCSARVRCCLSIPRVTTSAYRKSLAPLAPTAPAHRRERSPPRLPLPGCRCAAYRSSFPTNLVLKSAHSVP